MQRTTLIGLLLALSSVTLVQSQQTYSSLPSNYLVELGYVLNGVPTHPLPCVDASPACLPQVVVSDHDSIVVAYRLINDTATATSTTVTIQRCFSSASTQDRPWRQPNNIISKDKQCAIVKSGLPPAGNFTVTPNDNAVPAVYYVQVLQVNSSGQYSGKGRSLGYYQIIPIDSRPGWLIAMVSVFCCVGPLSLAAFFCWEQYIKKRK